MHNSNYYVILQYLMMLNLSCIIQCSSILYVKDHGHLWFLAQEISLACLLFDSLCGWIGPKNMFWSILYPSIKLLWIFLNFTEFSNNWLSEEVTDWCLQLSIVQQWIRLQTWFLHCSTSLHPKTCLFANWSGFSACLLPLSTFVSCSLLHIGEDLLYIRDMPLFIVRSLSIAKALLAYILH